MIQKDQIKLVQALIDKGLGLDDIMETLKGLGLKDITINDVETLPRAPLRSQKKPEDGLQELLDGKINPNVIHTVDKSRTLPPVPKSAKERAKEVLSRYDFKDADEETVKILFTPEHEKRIQIEQEERIQKAKQTTAHAKTSSTNKATDQAHIDARRKKEDKFTKYVHKNTSTPKPEDLGLSKNPLPKIEKTNGPTWEEVKDFIEQSDDKNKAVSDILTGVIKESGEAIGGGVDEIADSFKQSASSFAQNIRGINEGLISQLDTIYEDLQRSILQMRSGGGSSASEGPEEPVITPEGEEGGKNPLIEIIKKGVKLAKSIAEKMAWAALARGLGISLPLIGLGALILWTHPGPEGALKNIQEHEKNAKRFNFDALKPVTDLLPGWDTIKHGVGSIASFLWKGMSFQGFKTDGTTEELKVNELFVEADTITMKARELIFKKQNSDEPPDIEWNPTTPDMQIVPPPKNDLANDLGINDIPSDKVTDPNGPVIQGYAMGGMSSGGLIRVSHGETLKYPSGGSEPILTGSGPRADDVVKNVPPGTQIQRNLDGSPVTQNQWDESEKTFAPLGRGSDLVRAEHNANVLRPGVRAYDRDTSFEGALKRNNFGVPEWEGGSPAGKNPLDKMNSIASLKMTQNELSKNRFTGAQEDYAYGKEYGERRSAVTNLPFVTDIGYHGGPKMDVNRDAILEPPKVTPRTPPVPASPIKPAVAPKVNPEGYKTPNALDLQAARAKFGQELLNPMTNKRFLNSAEAELGSQGKLQQLRYMEEVGNRAISRGHTLDRELQNKSYYPPRTQNIMNNSNLSDDKRIQLEGLKNQFLGGSNESKLATGNWSGGEGRSSEGGDRGFGSGYITAREGYGVGKERFGVEGHDVGWMNKVDGIGGQPDFFSNDNPEGYKSALPQYGPDMSDFKPEYQNAAPPPNPDDDLFANKPTNTGNTPDMGQYQGTNEQKDAPAPQKRDESKDKNNTPDYKDYWAQ